MGVCFDLYYIFIYCLFAFLTVIEFNWSDCSERPTHLIELKEQFFELQLYSKNVIHA